jgi:hypothetical protein
VPPKCRSGFEYAQGAAPDAAVGAAGADQCALEVRGERLGPVVGAVVDPGLGAAHARPAVVGVERDEHRGAGVAAGKVKLPMVGLVDALDVSLQTLAQRVQNLLTPNYYRAPTVNATLKRRTISCGANVTESRLHMRLVDSARAVQNDSGWYPVRADGTLNLPHLGSVRARGRRLDEVQAEVQAGYRRDYLINAVVHVTPIELDAS